MSNPFEPDDGPARAAPVIHNTHPLLRPLEALEGWLFGVFALILSMFPLMAGVALWRSLESRSLLVLGFYYVALLGCFAVNVALLFRTWRAVLDGSFPAPVSAALSQWLWPKPLRPVIALYWFTLFAFAAVTIIGFERTSTNGEATDGSFYVVMFFFTLASNGCLMQSLAALGLEESTLRRVWKWRILIDVGLLAIARLIGNLASPYRGH